MERLSRKGENQTPKVTLDKENGIFEFSGQSLPENAMDFYTPILQWIEEYSKEPLEKTIAVFKMDYYNTASSKVLFEVLSRFNKLYESGKEVLIEWHYADDDEDMEEAGEEYADLLSVPFSFKDFVPED